KERKSFMSWDPGIPGKLKRNMMSQRLEEKREVHLARTKQRHHDRTALPLRLTSCIFKRPVTKITAHPGNEVRRNQREETLKKPQQASAFRRLRGLRDRSPEGDLFRTLDSANIFSGIAPGGGAAESQGLAGERSLHTSTKAIPAPSSDGAERIPGLGLFLPESLGRQPVVTYAQIRRQAQKVKQARERLIMALRADELAREAERARGLGN
uniref:Uncharacterized protein n=1 Tax=Catagonus wagneri TaxID=51154 RepID=A0A8C3WDK5_9CETA